MVRLVTEDQVVHKVHWAHVIWVIQLIQVVQVAGVSILMSYGENPHYVKLPIFSEFIENSTKFMKNSDLTKWSQNLR